MVQTKPRNEEQAAIFDEALALLATYASNFEVRRDAKDGYHLWSPKPIVIDGRKKKEIYFAGVVPQKRYAGFYYMSVYTDPQRKALFKPELLSQLKGKSCFHLRKFEPEVKKQIGEALEAGFELYRERRWV